LPPAARHRPSPHPDESCINGKRLGGEHDRRQAERLDRGELGGARLRHRRTGPPGAEVGVEQVGRIAARLQPRTDLVGREARLLDALAQHVGEPGLLLEGLLQRALCLGRRRQRRVLRQGAM